MSTLITVERVPGADEALIVISKEGASYIADVLEQHEYNDAGARNIVDAIREELGDGS